MELKIAAIVFGLALLAAYHGARANEIVYCKNISTGEITVRENYCPPDSFPVEGE